MRKLSVNVLDSAIVVDGVGRQCNLDALLPQLGNVRAIHIDLDGVSWVEPINGDPRPLKTAAESFAQPFYNAWTAAAEQQAAVPIDPNSVHIAYVKLALLEAGKLEAVDNAVEAAGGAPLVLWYSATEIRETDPEVIAIGNSIPGLVVSAIFTRARAIATERSNR